MAHGTGNAATQDCVNCHSTAPPFTSIVTPSNHIKLISGAACADCHAAGYGPGVSTMKHADAAGTCTSCHYTATVFAGTGQGTNGQPWQISGTVGTPGAGNHIPINGKDCSASGCHAVKDPMTANGAGFVTGVTPALSAAGHTTVALACQTCHTVGMTWKGITTLVTPTAQHIPPDNLNSGTVACVSCHVATSFGTGGFKITTSPLMSVAMHTAVAASVPLCTTCHESSAADLTFQGVNGNIYLRPNTGTSGLSKPTGQDPSHSVGNAATQDCVNCHTTAPPFTSVAMPGNHIKLITPTPSCNDCHAGGYAPGSSTMKHTDASGTCTSCHYTSTVFAGTGQGTNGQPWQISGTVGTPGAGNHIPINGKDCSASGCHAVKDPMTANGAGFVTGVTPALSAAGHTTVALACQTCHTVGMTWKGITTLVTPTAQHIPPDNLNSGTVACVSCHVATSFGTGGFKITTSPLMSVAMHTAVAASVPLCTTCHESSAADLTFQGVNGNIYLRPNTGTSGLSKPTGQDPSHSVGNAATQDCVNCHTTAPPFTSVAMPGNHIKLITPTPSCNDCHAGGYAPGSSTMKHTDASGTCTSCHYTSTVFAGTGQGTNGQPWQISGTVGTPGAGNHIPINGKDCSASGCHAVKDPMTANGAGFVTGVTPALSAAGHTTVALACQTCHTVGMTWKGITTLVTPTAQHIPPDNLNSGTVACVSCHVATSFGTGGFKITTSPVLSVAGHAAVSTLACTSCHEANAADLTFQGVNGNIYLRPNTSFPGLSQAVDASHTGNAATQDCGACHSTSPPFTAGKPSGHINVTAAAVCSSCHTVNTSSVVLPMPHTAVVGTCASCHNSATLWAGSVFTPNATGSGGTFGAQTGLNFKARQIVSSPAVGASGGHIPLVVAGNDCNVCHTSTSAFGPGTAMVHTGISSACATCHAAGAKWYGETYTASPLVTTGNKTLSPVHVPINLGGNPACEKCHSTTVFTSFGTATKVNHTSGAFMTFTSGKSGSSTPTCKSCTDPAAPSRYGVTLSTPRSATTRAARAPRDCINCHSTGSFNNAAAAARRPAGPSCARPEARPCGRWHPASALAARHRARRSPTWASRPAHALPATRPAAVPRRARPTTCPPRFHAMPATALRHGCRPCLRIMAWWPEPAAPATPATGPRPSRPSTC